MRGAMRFAWVPAIGALAAVFMVLPPTGARHQIRMVYRVPAFAFTPERLRVQAGAVVRFYNETDATHTASCDGCPWDSGDVQPGQFREVRVNEPGSYGFFCRYHGLEQRMTGLLEVTDAAGGIPSPAPSPAPSAS